jgi:adenosylcobinamide kinase/adenosylcobinamide-phosphate guanylyltransferase
MIVLVLGGTRSGKSEVAEHLAMARADDGRGGDAPVTFIATGLGGAGDPGFDDRIARHRARRPASWSTVEAGGDLVGALRAAPDGVVLVDSLGTWVGASPDLTVDAAALVDALRARRGDTVLVSEEVGLSVHPTTELGRHFADTVGDVNRAVAVAADEVLLVIAGRVLPLDPFPAGVG